MQGPLIVFLLIVVVSAIIGAVSQMLKAVQQMPQANQARPARRVPGGGANPGGASSDIDRFLEEIDRLRRKKASEDPGLPPPPPEPPVARPVQAERPRQARPAQAAVAPARPAQRRKMQYEDPEAELASHLPSDMRGLTELPTAPPGPAGGISKEIRKGTIGTQKLSPFATELQEILQSDNALAKAVIFSEILGPPKCKRG